MTRIAARIAASAILLLATAGCVHGPGGTGTEAMAGTDVRACATVYSEARCEALVTLAAEDLGVADDDVRAVSIGPEWTPPPDGARVTLGGSPGIALLVDVGGAVRKVQVCAGLPTGPACMDRPTVEIRTSIGAGYEDVTCTGEPPDGCPKPLPTLDPAAVLEAKPLRIDRRVIPVIGLGRQEIRLGTATIPNGVLTVARGRLADPWPRGVRFSSRGLWVEVRSLVPGRPAFMNLYEHGWWPATEAVDVFLVFEVRHVDPGATIEIRDIVVG
jgi:hypothetical protein